MVARVFRETHHATRAGKLGCALDVARRRAAGAVLSHQLAAPPAAALACDEYSLALRGAVGWRTRRLGADLLGRAASVRSGHGRRAADRSRLGGQYRGGDTAVRGRGLAWAAGLTLSPVLGLISGMVFVVKAGILAGTFYIHAAALFAVSLAMALLQHQQWPYGVSLFGIVSAATFFLPGWKYYRQSRWNESQAIEANQTQLKEMNSR